MLSQPETTADVETPEPARQKAATENRIITVTGRSVLSVGKTAISIKLVPTIASVGYIKATMYHNKNIILNNPFTAKSEACFFHNVVIAANWLTE